MLGKIASVFLATSVSCQFDLTQFLQSTTTLTTPTNTLPGNPGTTTSLFDLLNGDVPLLPPG